MNNGLYILHEEKVALVDQMSVVEEQLIVLEAGNLELREKIKMLSEKCGRGKGEASNLQIDLETSLNTAETKLAMALERNHKLDRDLVRVKEELEKSLKWTNSSKILTNLIGQGNNSRKGMGCEKIDFPHNPHYKSVSDADDLLCMHCGRDGHLKRDCPVLKKYEGSSSNYSKQRNRLKKGPGLDKSFSYHSVLLGTPSQMGSQG
ncbi:hypothetical protein KY284_035848 [Solanum tuberosum]|nr:hypothetical protein KY284_035848 [Solanum tuberosum]